MAFSICSLVEARALLHRRKSIAVWASLATSCCTSTKRQNSNPPPIGCKDRLVVTGCRESLLTPEAAVAGGGGKSGYAQTGIVFARRCAKVSQAKARGPSLTGASTAMPTHVVGNTFRAIELEPQATAELEFSKFVEALLQKLGLLKEERFLYYEDLRKKNTKWANGSRWVLALLGSIAFLLTGLAAALRFAPERFLQKWDLDGFDKGVLLTVLAIYAVMGAISFYEKGTDKTTAYFRQLGIILAIRDLWTKVQFEFLKELMVLKSAADPKAGEAVARERICALAEGFCNDLDKVATGELADWRTEFLASLSELEAAAKKGSEDVTTQIQEVLKTAEKAATDAKVSAEKAAADARTAAKTAEEAGKPGALNLALSGDFDDQVLISVDGVEVTRSSGKTIAIDRVVPGLRKISAHAKKGGKDLETARMVDVKPGLQDLELVLS